MKYDDVKNYDDFLKYVSNVFPNVNIDNKPFVCELYKIFKTSKTKRMRSIYDNMSTYMRSLRDGKGSSVLSIDYWKSMGWVDMCDIEKNIIEQQRKNSKRCKEYYITRGYSENESIKKVHEYQKKCNDIKNQKYSHDELSKMSVWSVSYWIKLGFSEDESKQIIRKYNGSCKECYSNEQDYYKHIKQMSDKRKELYDSNPEKFWMARTPYSSKEETAFFDNLSSLLYGVEHLHFGINVEKTELHKIYNKRYIICDGFIKNDNSIIILEYDGGYWHNIEYDELRDAVILRVRHDILGIIRVNDIFVKRNNIQTIKKKIEHAIEKIKSKKSKRELLYESK